MSEKLAVPTPVEKASLEELQQQFDILDVSVKAAQPQVDGMKATYEEAEMILADMKYRRGKLAYWLTMRKAQR